MQSIRNAGTSKQKRIQDGTTRFKNAKQLIENKAFRSSGISHGNKGALREVYCIDPLDAQAGPSNSHDLSNGRNGAIWAKVGEKENCEFCTNVSCINGTHRDLARAGWGGLPWNRLQF